MLLSKKKLPKLQYYVRSCAMRPEKDRPSGLKCGDVHYDYARYVTHIPRVTIYRVMRLLAASYGIVFIMPNPDRQPGIIAPAQLLES